MQETVTVEMIREAYSRVREPQAALVHIMADEIDDLFFTNYPEGIMSRGQWYDFFPFRFKWMGAGQDEPTRAAQIEIMNRDQRIAQAIRLAAGTPRVTVELIRISNPDVVEMAIRNARLGEAEVDDPNTTGTLMPKNLKTEPAVLARYTIGRTPGLF